MPLAIELAAAHLRLLSVAALAERLQDHFPLLQTRERVVDRRHQSMRAVVDWSYRLLDEAERRLFARLSVFRGGFTLEAAEALAPEANVLELLASLIDKSMVIAESTAESGIRYHLLETLRLYGQQRLEEIGELDVMQAAHAAYYCAMAEQAEPALHGAAQKVWSQRLQQEHDNLRAALQWALASPEPDQIQTEVGLRLAAALWWFWCLHIYISEGRKWLTLALDNSAGNAELEAPLARLTSRAGFLVGYLGDYKTAGRLANQAVALARRVDDHDSLGLAICVQGFRAWATGDQTGAIALFDEALTVLRAHGSRHLLGLVLVTTATIVLSLLSQNAYMAALVEEALPILEAVGDRYSMPRALCLKGTAALRKGNFKEGIENLERALHLAREMKIKADIGLSAFLLSQAWLPRGRLDLAEVLSEEGVSALDESGIPDLLASALRVQGMIAHRKGDLSHAEAYLTRSEQLLRQGGIGQGLAIVLREIGAVLLEQGRTADAERYFRESLDYAGNWAPELDQAHALYGLAAVAAQDGRPLRGARLAAFVDAMYEADPPPPLVEAGLAVLRPLLAGLSEALSEADLEAAHREGRRMSMEEAIAYARDESIRTL
jgi:predicted ATPase